MPANIRSKVSRATSAGAVLGLALLSVISGGTTGKVQASSGATIPQLIDKGQSDGTAQFTTVGSAKVLSTTKTIPDWSSSFTSNGVTYPYQMVGSNPTSGSSTTITNEIIPLRLVFADGAVHDEARTFKTCSILRCTSSHRRTTRHMKPVR